MRVFSATVAFVLLIAAAAQADEITFQESEVNLGQETTPAVGISGNEWATFGALFNGTSLLVYGPGAPDPFPPTGDNNGIFEGAASSFEIEFINPVANVELDWFALNLDASTMTAFDASGVATQIEVNPGGVGDETDVFPGPVKRIVVEAPAAQLCVANIRFEAVQAVPLVSSRAAPAVVSLMLLAIALVVTRRRRITSS